MGEADYNRLLDTVGAAMTLDPLQDFADGFSGLDDDILIVPIPANDNDDDGAWPHFAFPEGWTASC